MYETCDIVQCTFALDADAAQFLQSLPPTLDPTAEQNLRAQVAAWCTRLNLPVQGAIEIAAPPCLVLAWGVLAELDYAAPEFQTAAQAGHGIFLLVHYTFSPLKTAVFNGVAVGPQDAGGADPASPQP